MSLFSSRRQHTRYWRDWSSDVCSSDLRAGLTAPPVTGPAMNTPTASAKPTAMGAIAAGALSSVATAITTNTKMKVMKISTTRSEEHTSELQSRQYLVCRLLLEKKKKTPTVYSLSRPYP